MGSMPSLSSQDRHRLVTAVHDTPSMLVLAVAGGGNAIIPDLLDVGGASRTVLEIVVPYAESAMVDLVGPMPDDRGVVSADQADAMARAALARARVLAADETTPVIGVAATAALASDRPKRGEHRAHLAVAHYSDRAGPRAEVTVEQRQIRLTKGQLDRQGEDRVVADAMLLMVAVACGVDAPVER